MKNKLFRYFSLILTALLTTGCTALYLTDCPDNGTILGKDKDKPRIRTSQFRSLLADPTSAADRFVDYGVMSAYAYADPVGDGCQNNSEEDTLNYNKLKEFLVNERGWILETEAPKVHACNEDTGLFYSVWKRGNEVVIAFRGTAGFKDWWEGNSYWFRRLYTDDHQYAVARKKAKEVIKYMTDTYKLSDSLQYYTTGHSLGGGLAQGVFYEYPNIINQVYAFDPASATGYTSREDKSEFKNCYYCKGENREPRIFRIYEKGEILAYQRFFHKLIFPPEKWINEVRFNYNIEDNVFTQHSMTKFAFSLMDVTKSSTKDLTKPWYAAQSAKCTKDVTNSQSN